MCLRRLWRNNVLVTNSATVCKEDKLVLARLSGTFQHYVKDKKYISLHCILLAAEVRKNMSKLWLVALYYASVSKSVSETPV